MSVRGKYSINTPNLSLFSLRDEDEEEVEDATTGASGEGEAGGGPVSSLGGVDRFLFDMLVQLLYFPLFFLSFFIFFSLSLAVLWMVLLKLMTIEKEKERDGEVVRETRFLHWMGETETETERARESN